MASMKKYLGQLKAVTIEALNDGLHEDSKGYATKVYEHIMDKVGTADPVSRACLAIARRVLEEGTFFCLADCLGDAIIAHTNDHVNEEIIDVLDKSRTKTVDPLAEYYVRSADTLVEQLEEKYPLV